MTARHVRVHVGLGRFQAAEGMLRVAFLADHGQVRQFDRVDDLWHVPQDARHVDAALAQVEPVLPHDADQFGPVGGYLRGCVTQVREVEPFFRQFVQVLDPVARALEVVGVHHQPRVVPVHGPEDLDRIRQAADAGDGHVFEVDGQAEGLGQVADLPELLDGVFPVLRPDAGEHRDAAQLGRHFHGGQVLGGVHVIVDPRQLNVMQPDPGVGQRPLGLLQHRGIVGQRVVRLTRQSHEDGADADEVVAGPGRNVGHLRWRAAEDRQMGK
jgi:hypothetical protein